MTDDIVPVCRPDCVVAWSRWRWRFLSLGDYLLRRKVNRFSSFSRQSKDVARVDEMEGESLFVSTTPQHESLHIAVIIYGER